MDEAKASTKKNMLSDKSNKIQAMLAGNSLEQDDTESNLDLGQSQYATSIIGFECEIFPVNVAFLDSNSNSVADRLIGPTHRFHSVMLLLS